MRIYEFRVCFGVCGDVIHIAFHLSGIWNVIHLRSMVTVVDSLGVAEEIVSQDVFLWRVSPRDLMVRWRVHR